MNIDSIVNSMLMQRFAEARKIEEDKRKLLASPEKIDKLVAGMTKELAPTSKAVKKAKHATEVDAVEAVMPKGHAMQGFATEYRDRFKAALASPDLKGHDIAEIGEVLAQGMLMMPAKPGQRSRLEESYVYKRKADSELPWAPLRLFGEDTSVKRPPGYDEWLKGSREAESESLAKIPWMTTKKDMGRAVGIGAAAGALFASPMGATAAAGAVAGALGGAVIEAGFAPFAKLVDTTEWARARANSGSGWDKFKVGVAKYGPLLPVGYSVDKKMLALFSVAKTAAGAAAAKPTTDNILKAGQAAENLQKVAKRSLGINKEEFAKYKNWFSRTADKTPDQKAVQEAIEIGPEAAAANQRARDIADGKISLEKVESEIASKAVIISRPLKSTAVQIAAHLRRDLGKGVGGGKARLPGLPEQARKYNVDLAVDEAMNKIPDTQAFTVAVENSKVAKEAVESGLQSTIREKLLEEPVTTAMQERSAGWEALKLARERMKTKQPVRLLQEFETDAEEIAAELAKGPARAGAIGEGIKLGVPDTVISEFSHIIKANKGKYTAQILENRFGVRIERADKQNVFRVRGPGLPKEGTMALENELSEYGIGKPFIGKYKPQMAKETDVPWIGQRDIDEEAAAIEVADMFGGLKSVSPKDRLALIKAIGKKRQADSLAENPLPDNFEQVFAEASDQVYALRGKGIPAYVDEATGQVKMATSKEDILLAEQQAKRWQPYTETDVEKVGKDIVDRYKAGKITAAQAQKESLDVLESVRTSPKIELQAAREDLMSRVSQGAALFGKKASLMSFFGATGLGAYVFDMFDPDTAEAGWGSFLKAGKAVAEGADISADMLKQVKAAVDARYVVKKITDDKVFLVPLEGFQVGLRDTLAGGPSEIMKNAGKWVKDARDRLYFRIMSPGQVGEVVLNVGENNLNNPAVWKASYYMSELMNIRNGHRVFYNILKDAGIKSDVKELREIFQPLVPLMKQQVEFDHHQHMMKLFTSQIKRFQKTMAQGKKVSKGQIEKYGDIEQMTKAFVGHEAEASKLTDVVKGFHDEYMKLAEQAAMRSPSAKLFYALDDTAEFVKYPFLKNMPLTDTEKVALGRLREQLVVYKQRIKDIKEPTRKGPYAHYSLHPDFKPKEFEMLAGPFAKGAYSKFYSRGANSRPLLPDIEHSLMEYVYDIEKRIQYKDFWKRQGWERIEKAFGGYPSVAYIFKTLRDGTTPQTKSWGNKMINGYYQFEVFKHLFLNPSAGLKHLCKISGDIATRGPVEVARGIPMALKNVAWRVADLHPGIRKTLSSLGFKGPKEQDKFYKSYMDSLIPVMHHRQRLLDMGIVAKDEHFDTIKTVWNKAENTWGKSMSLGSVWINTAEILDRGASVMVGLRLAAKKGLTVEQAMYSNLDLILRNNFLGREMNPAWLRNPSMRALLIFQATPFKIMERRITTAIRTGRSVRTMGKSVFEATKTAEGRAKLWVDMKGIWSHMKKSERELKANIFIDALRSEVDVFGNPMVAQFAKEMATVGATLIGGAYAGLNLKHHFFHIPFISGYTNEPTLQFSPATMATLRGWSQWMDRDDADEEFLFTKVMKNWLGPMGPVPSIFHKLNRLSKDDIPEIYQDSRFQYFFAIPAWKKD